MSVLRMQLAPYAGMARLGPVSATTRRQACDNICPKWAEKSNGQRRAAQPKIEKSILSTSQQQQQTLSKRKSFSDSSLKKAQQNQKKSVYRRSANDVQLIVHLVPATLGRAKTKSPSSRTCEEGPAHARRAVVIRRHDDGALSDADERPSCGSVAHVPGVPGGRVDTRGQHRLGEQHPPGSLQSVHRHR